MKKILFTSMLVGAMWAGTRMTQMNSAAAQSPVFSSPAVPFTNSPVVPFTNHLGFTNTLVQVTNVTQVGMNDVVTILLSLQTNIEEALPVLSFLTTNTTVNNPLPTNLAAGPVMPITRGPGGLLAPTGAATGAGGQEQTSFSVRIGTNIFTLDPPTFQALVELQDDLKRALPVLQALNGTSPTNEPGALVPPIGNNVTSPPFRNGSFTPLTNQLQPLIPGF